MGPGGGSSIAAAAAVASGMEMGALRFGLPSPRKQMGEKLKQELGVKQVSRVWVRTGALGGGGGCAHAAAAARYVAALEMCTHGVSCGGGGCVGGVALGGQADPNVTGRETDT